MKRSKHPRVAYFCMEFGLDSQLQIYSGGLGILAGDILKAAKDLKYPMVGIGILWRQGYGEQRFDDRGALYDCYRDHHYRFLKKTGVTVSVRIRGQLVNCKVWRCDCFNNVPLYLLDTDLPNNPNPFLTGQLYGWFSEERVAQEMILGIGGLKALNALGFKADILHFNDCHPLFAGLELVRQRMDDKKLSFDQAWQDVRKRIVFTTHTPVPAGNEFHDHGLLRYMGASDGFTHGQLLRLGGDPFSMTAAGLRLARKANAVSQLHGKTARRMWKEVDGAAELIAITNGVHRETWQHPQIFDAFTDKGDLWEAHQNAKRELLDEVQARTGKELDHNALLIGFGRRATSYKRADLIFRNPRQIEPLLRNNKIQLIFSGKAHPHDRGGKEIIKRLHKHSRRYRGVVFLDNYDMDLGRLMTSGCDVWLNNPIRPQEASGTSGMKAAMNGVLNLSILDGWWPEACRHGSNGWRIGDTKHSDEIDDKDAASLYKVLRREVIPTYYKDRKKWLRMMRRSIQSTIDRFSAARMVEDYYQKLYHEEPLT